METPMTIFYTITYAGGEHLLLLYDFEKRMWIRFLKGDVTELNLWVQDHTGGELTYVPEELVIF